MKTLVSHPMESLHGMLLVPGDKSISHRALLLGAIAEGTTTVHGFLESEDCAATQAALSAMGVAIEGPVQNQLVIHGAGKYGLLKPKAAIDCGNSGTSMRLLAGILAAQPFDSTLTGDASLRQRPMARICNPLQQMGARISNTNGKAPLHIQGGQPLQGIDYRLPQASAQVKSAILLAGLYAAGQTRVHEPTVSRDHTERMLHAFTYPLLHKESHWIIDAASTLQGTDIKVPGDLSSAAFFIVAASIIPNSELLLRNVGVNPTRTGLLSILQLMGASIEVINVHPFGEEPVADIQVRYAPLQGITIPEDLVPLAIDEFPIVFIAAACATGQTLLHGAQELRVKESDRIAAMVDGLVALGIDACALEDGVRIQGGVLGGGVVDSHGDHRIAMSFAIAGAVASQPITVLHADTVATSFPTFVTTANALHFRMEERG